MSPDRVIYSFVLGWVVLLAVLIALDWLGNPNRGTFRPKGERPPRDRSTRRAERRRRRLEDDASVRAALRDAYGASSLRLTWTNEHESNARQLDDSLILEERADAVEVDSREVVKIDRTVAMGDPLPNPTEQPPESEDDEEEDKDEDDEARVSEAEDELPIPPDDVEPEKAERRRGWRVGGDPLSLTAKGDEPTPGTIRTRVWKNHAAVGVWSDENLARLKAGKAPRRINPLSGRHERAVVDVETGRATWGSEPVDPFGKQP